MSQAAAALRILHVRSLAPVVARERTTPSNGGSKVDHWLAAGAQEHCLDVYAALARLIRDTQRRIRAAVICVDDLGSDELEFFSLARRARHDVPLAVYTRGGNQQLVDTCLKHGAVICSEAMIRGLAEKQGSVPASAPEIIKPAPSPARIDAPPTRREAIEPARPAFPEPKSAEPPARRPPAQTPSLAAKAETTPSQPMPSNGSGNGVREEQLGEDDPAAPRVPWVRYHDAPARQKPTAPATRRTPTVEPQPEPPAPKPFAPISADVSESPRPSRSVQFEPLLTEEELRALMSDEFDLPNPDETASLLDDEGPGPSQEVK